ncbi:hypothetical protein [Pyrobaculum neutrophilum]|uniref:Uncharacterized protein n=1 Tax=Pyrobaculum neutrophilum (strain DSM 2338 / JCM 9278 / NBRC 100436 / V24Sta) TaxID=444157 RepID=B1Y9E3_PYRNV|nr:hypothetical protein [Pyrobaculum neutrophilum]ACB40372.1 conserved hypothetical protein [Pyrobaculum neutrophilum V24Sta]
MKALVYALVLAYLLAASTLVVTYTVKPGGAISAEAAVREVVINNGSAPLNYSGVVVPPYSAVVVERPVENIYPPFLRIDVDVRYVNGTLSEGTLSGGRGTAVDLTLRMYSLVPAAVPVVVSIPVDDKVALLYGEAPSSISQISGTTVYYWSLLVQNYTEFRIRLRVRQFGSFGAVRMPTVSAVAVLDINKTVESLEARRQGLEGALARLRNFTRAVSTFTDVAYGQIQNLTRLIQILNATGAAMEQGAVAVNASTYAVEALRRQMLALGDAARGVATTLNQSLLLVDYQYTALITAANLLEVQSAALTSYNAAAGEAEKSLINTRSQLYTVRANLIAARQQLDTAIKNVEEAKRRLSALNATTREAKQAVNFTLSLLDATEAQLAAARAAVDSYISTVDALISTIDSTIATLDATRRSLGELAPLLNNTASSTRANATVLRKDMPQILLNASKNLLAVADNLYKTAGEVYRFVAPLHNASRLLRDLGRRLVESAGALERYREEQLRALPKLGYVESTVYNLTEAVEREKRDLDLQIAALKRYYGAVNVSRVELQYYIQLPIVVKNITFALPPAGHQTNKPKAEPRPPVLALATTAVVATVMFLALRRREKR